MGLAHGAAGSGALVALVAATSLSPAMAVGYVVIFGLGAASGMALLSLALSWPLRMAERIAARALGLVRMAVALMAIGIGLHALMAHMALLLS